ncbi:MAG: ABC transporter permease [Gemmatimonadales bacterium]|jgi:putative ABC transport system permease protein
METVIRDIGYALRSLRRNPSFVSVALLTIGLGIGINTAIFSVVHAILLRPLPYPESHELFTVWENLERRGGPPTEWTGRSNFLDWRERNRTFAEMSAVSGWAPNLTGIDRPEVLAGALVSPGYFKVLAVEPAAGRAFVPDEETPGNSSVAVLSHELWQSRFGGAPDVVGSNLTLDGQLYTVVGIMPPGFHGPIVTGADIWSPLPIDRARDDRGNYFLRVIGRLAPGVSREAAAADMNRLAALIAEEHPIDYRDVGTTLIPLQETVVGSAREPLLVLLGAVGLILLIACANVANLLLARASVRERELAVRSALGAGRMRLLRQLLTESLVLAVGGGVVGLGLGIWGTDALVALIPPGVPRAAEIGMHPTVFLFTVGVALATGLLFGLAPALVLSGSETSQALRERATVSRTARGERLRSALVVGELAIGMTVLAAAGLLLRSFVELRSVDPGFEVEGTLSARLFLPAARYPGGSQINAFLQELEERLRAVPAVHSFGAITVLPLSGLVHDISFGIEGRLPLPGEEPAADSRRATPGLLKALGVPLLRGRWFEESDREGTTRVAVINETLARRHFAGEDPIGRRIKVGGVRDPESPWWTIVGVVGSVSSRALNRAPEPEIYVPAAQQPARGWSIVVRADGDAAALAPPLRDAVWSLDPDMAISQLATLETVFAASIASERLITWLLAAFAALAVLLGAIGTYGVMAFRVSRRTRELGIRIALGARRGDVLGEVMRRGAWLTLGGLALGLAAALAAGQALSNLLFEVSPIDPLTLAGVATLLAATALFACYWPARRATRVDPLIALRSE